MDADAERTLNNLHVLGALSHNDKLLTNCDTFDIYSPTSMRGLFRMLYGERRYQNVARVRQALRAAIGFSSRSLEDADALRQSASSSPQMRLRIDTTIMQHMRMCEALSVAKGGLQNLLLTYRDDAALVSQLQLLVVEVGDFLRVMEPHTARLSAKPCDPTLSSYLPLS
jgi:hypothetical protein